MSTATTPEESGGDGTSQETGGPPLPAEFVDAHHHFLDTDQNTFQSFLKSLVGSDSYLPGQYQTDVVDTLASSGITVIGTVHVECMPDSGQEESSWIQSLIDGGKAPFIKAIVGSCDLASPHVDSELAALKATSPHLHGVRWIVDCVGKFEGGKTATHAATLRHDGVDYLRGSDGGHDGDVIPVFENGFRLLEKYGLSFDLQCAPSQLLKAAELCGRHPAVPTVIDHLGKPRMVLGADDPTNANTTPDEEELRVWRTGMDAMASLPHVYVKISMLGYIVPGWIRTPDREAVLRGLVRETVERFGPSRCMVATNWWKNGIVSDADALSEVGPDAVELLKKFASWFEDYSEEDRRCLFSGTAKHFYRL